MFNNYKLKVLLNKFLKINKFKKEINPSIRGYIESILPNEISGWFLKNDKTFKEIGLFHNDQLLAKTLINLRRNDVCIKYKTNENCGFKLKLNQSLLSNLKKNVDPLFEIRGINNKNVNSKYVINHIKFPNLTSLMIKNALNPFLIGSDGYLEGLKNDGFIYGWISINH